ncbi:MAG TPA: carboxypeptidase regulatory-like domain-containing protein [Vicinamibacterales bacterium]|nr:carboxypeptidase regulatory-like domain-containing protein [Vicinamibacterales bacterium]
MKRAAFTVILITALALPAAALAPRDSARAAASAPSTISGRVVDAESGAAVANVRIAVTPSVPGAAVTLTDADGRFSFSTPSPRVTLTITRAGYARTTAAAAASGAPIELQLTRGAAVEGRVVDEVGEPAVGAPVEVRGAPGSRFFAQTDDRGEFRIGGLAAGTIDVTVLGMDPNPSRGATPTGEKMLTLEPGEVASDIDFVVPAASLNRMIVTTSRLPIPSGSGVIRGSVTTTDGRAIPRANVELMMRAAGRLSQTMSDAFGQFAFTDVPAGTLMIEATKAGYEFPSPFAADTLTLADGGSAQVALHFDPVSAIAGVVSDENGDPMQGVSVQALGVRYERGARRLVPIASSRNTDDLGQYRLFGLPPGEYVVSAASASPQSGDLPGYVRSYYPGTDQAAQAQFVSVGSGDTVGGIDLTMARARTAKVSGHLLDAAGEPSTTGRVQLVPSVRSSTAVMVPLDARLGDGGSFEFASVSPGQYVLQVDRGRRGAAREGEFGSLAVTVADRDVTGLVLQTQPGSTITGRIELDSASGGKLPSLGGLEIRPIPVDFDAAPNDVATADIRDDGTFIMQGVSGVRRIEVTRAPAGWMLEEVRAAGIDVTDRPMQFGRPAQSRSDIEIVLTDRVSGVAGTVRDDNGSPVANVRVIVFPAARDLRYPGSRYLEQAMTSATGAYSVTSLPAGSYYVAAIPQAGDDPNGWQDPQRLESFTPIAQSAVVRDGETTTVDLRQTSR